MPRANKLRSWGSENGSLVVWWASEISLCQLSLVTGICVPIGYLTIIIPRVRVGYEMIDSQRGA